MNTTKRTGSYLENAWLMPVVLMASIVLGSGYLVGMNYIERAVLTGLVAMRDAAPGSMLTARELPEKAASRAAEGSSPGDGGGTPDESESVYVGTSDVGEGSSPLVNEPATELCTVDC